MANEAAEFESNKEAKALNTMESTRKKSIKWAYFLGIFGIVATILMVVAVIYYKDELNSLQHWGYLGAFIISILGGATIIMPIPMLAVVFALGGAMDQPWQVALVGLSAALGELVGALTIYMTGHGAGRVIVTMIHTTKDDKPRIVNNCTFPLTAIRCVSLIITDLAVIEVAENGLVLREIAPGWTVEEVQALTEARLTPAADLKEIEL